MKVTLEEADPRTPAFAQVALEEASDADLARALMARLPNAPRAVWHRFSPMVARILRRTLGPGHEVADLVQDVFLCLFERAPGLREPKAIKAFIISITLITTRIELRRLWMRRWLQLADRSDANHEGVTCVDTESREALKRFYRILDRLNARDRTLFALRHIEELSVCDVAEIAGLSLATTKRRLTRAWSKVRLLAERDPVLSEYLTDHRGAPLRRQMRISFDNRP
jgi:RNA polymerase sigma-70 factor (ECF subfamily)